MRFKTSAMEDFFKSPFVHPDIVSAAVDFHHWSAMNRMQEPFVSDLQRSRERNAQIYYDLYRQWRHLADTGKHETLSSMSDQRKALECRDKTDPELLAMARARNSWHICGCAIDFSGNPYTDEQAARVLSYFQEMYLPTIKPGQERKWEFKLHSVVGDRAHFHLGRRDSEHQAKLTLIRGGGHV